MVDKKQTKVPRLSADRGRRFVWQEGDITITRAPTSAHEIDQTLADRNNLCNADTSGNAQTDADIIESVLPLPQHTGRQKGFILQKITPSAAHPDDTTRSLRYEDVLERRRAMLKDAHIARLTSYVEELRERPRVEVTYEVPYFDPLDGGVNAKILFLLEKPGPRAAGSFPGSRGSGFISRNNNDQTAKATWKFMNEINLPRVQTVIWNVIPGWNGTMKITAEERRKGVNCVGELVSLLPKLKAIVLVGNNAQTAEPLLKKLDLNVKIFKSAHPSPIVRAANRPMWDNIPTEWAKAKTYIGL